jgi:hypothetical protein
MPFSEAIAAAIPASACAQFEAGVTSDDAIGIAQSFSASWMTETAAPLRTAARTRSANNG